MVIFQGTTRQHQDSTRNQVTITIVSKPIKSVRKTASKPPLTLQAALRSKDSTAVATLLLADLAAANALHESLLGIIAAQAKQIQGFRGLASLAIGQGPR